MDCSRKLEMKSPRMMSARMTRGSSKNNSASKKDSLSKEPPLSEKVAEIENLWNGLKEHWTSSQKSQVRNDEQHNTISVQSNWINLDETDIYRSVETMIGHFEHKLNCQRQILIEFDAQRAQALSFLKNSLVQKKEQSQFSSVKTSRTGDLKPNDPIKQSINASKINPVGDQNQKDFAYSLPISLANSRIIPSMTTSQVQEKQSSAKKVISKQIQEDNQRLDALAVEIERALMKAKEKFN